MHLFTASGVIWAFLALLSAVRGDMQGMFLWLAIALFVDGIDGSFARRIDIENALPRFSGAALDLIIDFLTYVFVPVYALVESGLIARGWDIGAALIILLTSAMYFADNEMKTEDAWFRGFPAIWNVAVFYIFLLAPWSAVTFVIVVVLAALTFAPMVFDHPLRVVALRPVTLTLLVIWSLLALYAIWRNMAPEPWVVWTLCLVGAYFLILGAFRTKPSLS